VILMKVRIAYLGGGEVLVDNRYRRTLNEHIEWEREQDKRQTDINAGYHTGIDSP
jgi:hypothetical protein